MTDIAALREAVRPLYTEKRYPHVLGTERECASLAEMFSLSPCDGDRLCRAALLHDITKRLTLPEQLELYNKYNLPGAELLRFNPKIAHSATGAVMARELFGEYCDAEMAAAIACHTTGKPDMTLFEQLLYLADYIEPTRTFPDCVLLREFFLRRADAVGTAAALPETMLYSYELTIRNLLDENEFIHPDTVSARNALLTHPAAH